MPVESAISALIHHFEGNPEDAVAINDLGVLHTKLGLLDAALSCYRKAHRLAQENTNIAKNLADLLFVEFGDLNAAMALYVEVLRQYPNDCDSLLASGHISAAIDHREDAKMFYQRVCQIEPGHPQALAALAKLNEAQGLLKPLLVQDVAAAYETLIGSSQGDTALPTLETFALDHPDFPPVFNDLGVLYAQSGDSTKALVSYRRAIDLDPVNTTFLKNLADHLFIFEGNLIKATKFYVDVLKLDAFDTEALFALASISRATGDEEGVTLFMDRIREIDPDFLLSQPPFQEMKHPSDKTCPVHKGLSGRLNAITGDNVIVNDNPKVLDATVYLIGGDDLSLVQRRIAEFKSNGEHKRLCVLLSSEVAERDSQTAVLIKKVTGEGNFICAPSDQFSAVLSNSMHKDPNPYLALIWDTVRVNRGWLTQLKQSLENRNEAVIVGPMSNFAQGVQQKKLSTNMSIEEFETIAIDWYKSHRHQRIIVPSLDAHCVLISKNALIKIGSLDKKLTVLEAAIDDWCLRARLAGYTAHITGDTLAYKKIVPPVDKTKKNVLMKKWNRLIKSEKGNYNAILELKIIEEVKNKYYTENLAAALEMATSQKDAGYLSAPSLMNLVELCIDARQFEEADRFCQQLLEKSDNSRVLALAGVVKEGLKDSKSAEYYADIALKEDAKQAEARDLKGMLAYRKNDMEVAKSYFQQAIEADEGFGDPYANLATLIWAEDQEVAFKLYKEAFKLSPHKIDIADLFQSAMNQLAYFDEGEQVILEAISRYPKVRLLRYLAIDLYLQQGQLDDALNQVVDVLCDYPIDKGFLDSALKIRKKIDVENTFKAVNKSPSLALGMIVKNEERNIANCLASVLGLVDEIIVVDTGSDDNTVQIAEILGATVVPHEWNDSFAEARNVYLKNANADWILILDADEVISKKDHCKIRSLLDPEKDSSCAYTIPTRNYEHKTTVIGWRANTGEYPVEERGSGWVSTEKVRLFPNDKRLNYSFPVHEMIEPALKKNGYSLEKVDIPVHHYGKLNGKELIGKDNLYYKLGKIKLEQTGDDVYSLRELAIQAGLLGKYDEAIDFWKRFLKNRKDIPDAYINMVTAYFHLGQYNDAFKTAINGYRIAPHNRECIYNYGLMAMHTGNLDLALELGNQLENLYPDYNPGIFLYACACLANKDMKGGKRLIEKLESTSLGPFLYKTFETFLSDLSKSGQNEYVTRIIAVVGEKYDEVLDSYTII